MDLSSVFDLSKFIGLAQAAKLMRGRGGRCPNVESLRRWANPARGCYPAGKQGPQVLLMTVRHHGELLTLPEWVEAFERRCLELSAKKQEEPLARSPRAKNAGHRRAEEELDKAGVGGERRTRSREDKRLDRELEERLESPSYD